MKKWKITFWVCEYKTDITITSNSVIKTGDETISADGIEIDFHDEVVEICVDDESA